jgi:hypothetical protein
VAASLNRHSLKNRYLMRIKNMDAATYAHFFLPITLRDLSALGYVLLHEPASLRALPLLCERLSLGATQSAAEPAPRRARDMRSRPPTNPLPART